MKKGISEVIATILMLMITIALAGTAYMYITGVFGRRARTLSLVDGWCAAGTVSVIIRNDGPDAIKPGEQSFVTVDASCTGTVSLKEIPAGRTETYSISGCAAPRIHRWRLVGPANTVEINIYCS